MVLDGLPPVDFNAPIILEGDEDLDHITLETGGNILMEQDTKTLNEDQGFATTGSLDRVELETGGIQSQKMDNSHQHHSHLILLKVLE